MTKSAPMWVLRFIVLGISALMLLLMAVGAVLPRRWYVDKSIVVHAPPEAIHALTADFSTWERWTACNKTVDPRLELAVSKPSAGLGATLKWHGPAMGTGFLRIIWSDPSRGVGFEETIESKSINAQGSIRYAIEGDTTRVRWKDTGLLPPVIGGYFVKGVNRAMAYQFQMSLEKLKALAEQSMVHKAAHATH